MKIKQKKKKKGLESTSPKMAPESTIEISLFHFFWRLDLVLMVRKLNSLE